RATVTVCKERLSNLAAVAPTLDASGGVSFGYRVTGPVEVNYRDYVEVELYYARGPELSRLTTRIDGRTLRSAPGTVETFRVPGDRIPAPPAGTTHLVTVVDRHGRV